MFESKYSKLLTGLLIAGIIAVIGILAGIGIYITNNAKLKKEQEDSVNHYDKKLNETIENICNCHQNKNAE